MHLKDDFVMRDVEEARAIVRAHPFATIVGPGLRATHMPVLVDEAADGLALLGHVARADPVASALRDGGGELLLVFAGPRGYVSASWYASSQIIPTWNHVTLHVRGTPVTFDDALPVLRRTVDHFEAAVERPWSLDEMDDEQTREMAGSVVAFRLEASWWHAEAKLSQDKPRDERTRIVDGLASPGPYANAPLADAMRARSL